MFGYVSINKARLTEAEYEAFTAYYCGVCRATGKCASQISRLGLNYDITFLALVLGSVFGEGEARECRCVIHPHKNRLSRFNEKSVDYSASVGVMLSYLKLLDDWKDDRSVKALLGMAIFKSGYNRVRKQYPREYDIIKVQLDILSRLEREKSASIDDTAEAFGKILSGLFTPDFVTDTALKRECEWLGLNLGRWIYTIDAINDLESDIKSGSYNPFKEMGYKTREECVTDMEMSLMLTLEGIASAFELMSFKANRDLIGKIIYIGLKEKQNSILHSERKDNK